MDIEREIVVKHHLHVQNYGMVEFQLPSAAAKAKAWADSVEATMRPTRDSEVCTTKTCTNRWLMTSLNMPML